MFQATTTFSALEIGGIVALVAQTGALFYWGGALRQTVRDHERRIGVVETHQEEERRQAERRLMERRQTGGTA